MATPTRMDAVESPQDREARRKRLGTITIKKLTEDDRNEYFRLIDADEHGVIERWSKPRQVKLLRIKNTANTDLNGLMYAIWRGKLQFAQMSLQTLLDKGSKEQIHEIVLAKTSEEENLLQCLIGSMKISNALGESMHVAHLLLNVSLIEDDYIDELITNETLRKKSAIFQAVNSYADWADQLTNFMFQKLSYDKKMKLLRETPFDCPDISQPDKPQKIVFNLLYAAQKVKLKTTVESIVKVLAADTPTRRANADGIVLGRELADTERPTPSSLFTAAIKYDQWEHFLQLIKVMTVYERFKALMETFDGKVSESVLGWLLWYPEKLKKVTEIPYFENSIQAALKELKWEMLFAEHQMPLEAVQILGDLKVFSDSFLIPKFDPGSRQPLRSLDSPLPVSRPVAMLFYNESKKKRLLKQVKPESEKLKKALLHLNWGEDNVILDSSEWTAKEMKDSLTKKLGEVKSYCSLFLLSMTGHGSEKKMEAHKGCGVKIVEVVKACTDMLEPFIPKVIILDRCRTGDWKKPHCLLREGNVLILDATLAGTEAHDGHYLTKLANEIIKGNDTLQNMHKRASRLAAADTKKKTAKAVSEDALEQPM